MKKPPAPFSLSEDEREEFRQAMRGVKPLNPASSPPPSLPIASKPGIQSRRWLRPVLDVTALRAADTFSLVTDAQLSEVSSAEFLSFSRGGIQEKVWKALRRGELPTTAYLDLHGLTVLEAQSRLFRFLEQAVHTGARCVRVVHGKSGRQENSVPILKNKVNQWLRAYPFVLAFCSAAPRHGGAGAVNVLLKSAR